MSVRPSWDVAFRCNRDGDDTYVKRWSCVTEQERAELKQWKPHILALLDYQAPEVA